jgi:hypothetical protein
MNGPAERYNVVYEKLVLRDDDLVGLIAYALYKQRKRAWIVDFKAQQAREPSQEEERSYLIGETTTARLSDYRQQSESILASYADEVIKSATPTIQREAIAGRIEGALRWYQQIPAGVVAAFTYTLVLIGIVSILKYAGIDLLSILNAGKG